ncbi:hypothetical protein DCAR_0625712 [Daucus carota subsp. sativus]|uniref:Uncharacterized protein n=1 Tax=Daucus carota subsp. sativus TaxID=79200 RepID=A0A164WMN9_DAUCS|nr:hypothetical protein DCAR_0625712 [Daucus carota subsp. sativus]
MALGSLEMMIDKSGKVLYFFYGPTSQTSAYNTELEALIFLLRTYFNSEYKVSSLAVFMDSLNLAQHFNSRKLHSNGPIWSWAHSVTAVYIESCINTLADSMAKEDWDQGMGIQHPDFMDIMVPFEAPDPVDFNVSIPLAEQVSDLGLGQINAPRVARMELDVDEMNDVIDGAVEDSFIASFGPKGPLWAHEPPLGEMD